MSMTRRDVAGALGAAAAAVLFFRSSKAQASKCPNIDNAISAANSALAACKSAANDYGGEKAKAMQDLTSALAHLNNCLTNPQCR